MSGKLERLFGSHFWELIAIGNEWLEALIRKQLSQEEKENPDSIIPNSLILN